MCKNVAGPFSNILLVMAWVEMAESMVGRNGVAGMAECLFDVLLRMFSGRPVSRHPAGLEIV